MKNHYTYSTMIFCMHLFVSHHYRCFVDLKFDLMQIICVVILLHDIEKGI